MTQPPSYPSSGGMTESLSADDRNHTQKHGANGEEFESDSETEMPSAATLSKAISKQSSHYMLTFENGLQDGESDSEVEELTKALSVSNDDNNNSNTDSHQLGASQGGRTDVQRKGASTPTPPPHVHAEFVPVIRDRAINVQQSMAVHAVKGTAGKAEHSEEVTTHDPTHSELQIPSGDSDLDNDSDPHAEPTGGFLHVADDGNSSIRPDTPTPTTPRSFSRTRIAVDSNTDSGSESGFVRPKPLSGSTMAMCGSVESLSQRGSGEVQYSGRTFWDANKRFSASELNLTDTPRPPEGYLGSAFRRKAFHQSMNRLSLGAMPTSNSTVSYVSDEESGRTVVKRRAVPSRRGLSRRWSLAHADNDSLDEIR